MKRIDKLCFNQVRMPFAMIGVIALFTACGSQPTSDNRPGDIPVNIVFDDSHCPIAVDPSKPFDVSKSKGQHIAWQAVNKAGKPVDERYEIFFDPFKGNPIKARSHGSVRSPKISGSSPINVEYKYSIRGEKCERGALDPRFRISF